MDLIQVNLTKFSFLERMQVKKVLTDKEKSILEITSKELNTIITSLNEVVAAIEEWEIEIRLGMSLQELLTILIFLKSIKSDLD